MIRKNEVRQIYESVGSDPHKFRVRMGHLMGLCDADGHVYRSPAGHARLRDPKTETGTALERLKPSEFSLAAAGRGVLGDEMFERLYNPETPGIAGFNNVMEAAEGAIPASTFANISAFTGVVSGLLEVAILEGWENPAYIGDRLMPDEPSRQFEGRKTIGASRIADASEERLSLMPTKVVQFGERWLTQPRTAEYALACEVSIEAVFLDLTGQVVETANQGVGERLRYDDELRRISTFIGATNNYNYKGSSYNTYLASSTWDNDFANELLYESDVEEALIKFRDMADQETARRVQIQPNAVLVNREKARIARGLMGDLAFGTRYTEATTAAHNARLTDPAYAGQFEILESPLVYEMCVAATTATIPGLGLSASDAAKYWWMFEKGKPFKNVVNWPFRVQSAVPGQKEMLSRGVAMYTRADVRSVPMVVEPRRVVRNKAAG